MLVVVSALTVSLFIRSTTALDRQLRETLRVAAVAAALPIDGDLLEDIHTQDDTTNPAYAAIGLQLRTMVDQVPQARFAYILRRTDDPMILEFVIDADAMLPFDILDIDSDGELGDDEVPGYPGDEYDVSDIPALQGPAFEGPTTDAEVEEDQWGRSFSGYAPIRSFKTGEVVAVLGIDMDAEEYEAYTRSALSPVAVVLIVLLVGLLALGAVLLIAARQLRIVSRVNAERSGLLQLTFHQLGEPITILQWGIETLEDMKDDPEALKNGLPENLTDMREGVRRLGSIIDTLQEAEKVELNVFENHPVQQSLRTFMNEAVALIAPPNPTGRVLATVDVFDGTCEFDPHLLTIVLRRLIENAIEFTPKEGLPVKVIAREEGKWLRIDIVDNGCGIPEKDMKRMFEKYFRASNATSMKPDGNGLGLYIAKGLIELMGGTISMQSLEGKGTTVTIRLPHHPKGA